MNIAIIRFPGTNCDFDMEYSYKKIGANPIFVWHKESSLPKDCELVVLPGGFSYGDYLRSGAIARFSPVMEAVVEFAKRGGKVLGICNGFQILLEVGLLDGAMKRNENLHFVSKKQKLIIENTDNIFLSKYKKGEEIILPIAHGEGNYFNTDEGIKKVEGEGLVLLRYVDNPNGSLNNIAGICNKEKTVYGLMPHPERAIEDILGCSDGYTMLESLLR